MSVFVSQSPLQNPLILELISSYLPNKDLLSCVKVCHFWKEEMGRVLERRTTAELSFPYNEESFKEMTMSFEESKCVPSDMIITGHLPRDDIYLKKFLSKWGMILGSLEITAFDVEWTAPILLSIFKDFSPNLQDFEFGHVEPENDVAAVPNGENANQSLIKGMRQIDPSFEYPSLTCLSWAEDNDFEEELADFCYLFPSLRRLTLRARSCNRHIALNELKSSGKLYWQDLRKLSYSTYELCHTPLLLLLHLKPQLECFSLTFSTISKRRSQKHKISVTFRNLLSLMTRLDDLAIYQMPTNENPFISCSQKMELNVDLPLLPNLKTFKMFPGKMLPNALWNIPPQPINENIINVQEFSGSFADLNSSFLFPNLEYVSLVFPKRELLFAMKDYVCYPSVTILVLHPKNVDDKLFHILPTMFPNLKVLEIRSDIFSIDFDHEPSEPEFAVGESFYLLTDFGITGVSLEEIKSTRPIKKKLIFPSLSSFRHLLAAIIDLKYTAVTSYSRRYGPWRSVFAEENMLFLDFSFRSGFLEADHYFEDYMELRNHSISTRAQLLPLLQIQKDKK